MAAFLLDLILKNKHESTVIADWIAASKVNLLILTITQLNVIVTLKLFCDRPVYESFISGNSIIAQKI